MWSTIKRTLPGIGLILAASSLLLLVDGLGLAAPPKKIPSITILQFSSRPVLEDSVRGAKLALKEAGFEDGRDIRLRILNPENDLPTANSMAKLVVDSDDALAITFSTPLLQVFANVNKEGKKIHLFGTVTNPFAAGVGITKEGHPRHLAGIGTFQPVREVLQLAKKLNPRLRSIGTVWNPSDAAAEACVLLARDECAKLGITLIEVQVDSSTAVAEAAMSVVSRGAQAFWIGGDNTVELAMGAIVQAARKAGIPVFSNAPSHLSAGAFVGMGADYLEVGKAVGAMAAKVLRGMDPATVKIENVVPIQLGLNLQTLAGMREVWTPGEEVLSQAAILVDGSGATVRSPAGSASAPGQAAAMATPQRGQPHPKPWKFQLINFTDSLFTEETQKGIQEELPALGLQEGRDYVLKIHSAHNDLALLNTITDAVLGDQPDLILVQSTATLQMAAKKIKTIPIVYTSVGNGVLAGAGTSNTDHLPNITGINTISDFETMVDFLLEIKPGVKSIGTVFSPGEINSVNYRDLFQSTAAKRGISLIAAPASSLTEVEQAASALAARRPEFIVQISDNLTGSAFPAIVSASRKAGIPILGFVASSVEAGAIAAVARDYYDAGKQAVGLAIRIMGGESPASIPFTTIEGFKLVVSPANAAFYGLVLPDAVLKRADKVVR